VAGIEHRLKRLESAQGVSAASASEAEDAEAAERRRRIFDRLYEEMRNAHRERDGLEPEYAPYDEVDRRCDEWALGVLIPALRRKSPGWQTGDGAAFLDQWEGELLERLTTKGEHTDD
jgi:hypothetical protein